MLVFLLRLSGTFTSLAFLAMLLPVAWMDSIHRSMGLGELPRAPVVDYLARSVAALYGFHGALLLLISTDPVKYRTIVWLVSILNIVFGMMLVVIDLHAGMPKSWTLFEGPPLVVFGIVIAWLNRHPR